MDDEGGNNTVKASLKERKKLKKKNKRKERRKQNAIEKEQIQNDPSFIAQVEMEQQLLELEEKHIQQQNEEVDRLWREKEAEFREKMEQERLAIERKQQQHKETLARLRKEKEEKFALEQQRRAEIEKQRADSQSQPGVYGTEKDTLHCSFYLKTGSCRFGDRCGKGHPYPSSSVTILFKNMYDGLGMREVADEDADDDLQYDENEILKHYRKFYEDVLPEFEKFGELEQFKTCRNYAAHLRGNVYIQYKDEQTAMEAFNGLVGRFYASKQLFPEFVPVTNWKSAICGLYERKQCPRGKECNFLHVFKNPGEFSNYRSEPRYSDRSFARRDWDTSERYRDRHRDRDEADRERHRDRDRDRERYSRERDEVDRERHRDRDRDDRERHRDRDRDEGDRERYRDRDRDEGDRERHRESHKERHRDKDERHRDRERKRDRHKDRSKDEVQDRSSTVDGEHDKDIDNGSPRKKQKSSPSSEIS